MEDKPESKPPFWSSLPGIFTGLGGVIVAVTGLITALYTAGVIGSKANSNVATNSSVTLASLPETLPSLNPDTESLKSLAGKWEIIEERSKELGGAKIKWLYEATVSGNVLTLTGRMTAFNNKDLTTEQKAIRSIYVNTMTGLAGHGEYKITERGGTMSYPATIRFEGDQPTLHGTIEIKGQTACALTGSKLEVQTVAK